MKRIATAFAFLTLSFAASAQKFDYNVNFDYLFRNYEYDGSMELYHKSYTLHAARLTPEAGLLVIQNDRVFHRVRFGVDIYKDMGARLPLAEHFKEFIFYYNAEVLMKKGRRLEAVAGCFPRRFAEGDYEGPFFRDDLLFTNPNLEGAFVKYSSPRLYAEFGLDWNDRFDDSKFECFQMLSAGCWNFAGPFSLCWTGLFYHFNCAPASPRVIDNHTLELSFKWAPRTSLDDLSISAGGLLSFQRARYVESVPQIPMGIYSRQHLSKWGLHIDNRIYAGGDLMPYYGRSFDGVDYTADLYLADTAFHTMRPGFSWADCLRVRYEPRLTKFLTVRAELSFSFGEPYPELGSPVFRGWRQTVALRLDLNALRPHPKTARTRERRYLFEGFVL